MLVIDRDGTVIVNFDPARMAVVNANTDTWIEHVTHQPDKLRRFARRGLLELDSPEFWDVAIERFRRGFMGELAVAAYLRAPYEWRLENPWDAEVDGVQVRTAALLSHCLITHEYDPPAPYVLAVADYGTATVVLRGWLHLRHCNVPAHWRPHATAPAYFVPPTALHPMATLREHYTKRKRRCA